MVLTRRQRIADVVERLPADVQPRAALLLDQLQSDDNALAFAAAEQLAELIRVELMGNPSEP
ncbi:MULTISPECIES: hypothetical protein [unclassified Synechococcus]|uniref:hypothetical protein n=1 Tax=unclassified Synechococcus TaxID=2626047 RepID=UPI0039AE98E7